MTPRSPSVAAAGLSALTLRERLAMVGGPAADPVARPGGADDLVGRWKELLDRNGPERFARRLRWDGLEEAGVRAALRAAPSPPSLAAWEELLDDACAAARHPLDLADPALDATDPIPFEELLLPFVQAARRRLEVADAGLPALLAPGARASLDRALLGELSAIAEQALHVELSVAAARRGGLSLGSPSRAVYQRMVDSARAAGLEPLLARYPVLARLLAVRALLWVGASAELAARLRADRGDLANQFGEGALSPVVGLRAGRGDTHCGGRAVATVRFGSGLEIMYKPRSLKLDVAFYGLLDWLGERGLHPVQRTLTVLDRGEYGWVEFVRWAPSGGESEIAEYYERAGALLCLSHLLGASDLHAENLIAAGAHPVPVDLEMMMTAPVVSDGGGPLGAGLLSIGLLPYWQTGAQGPVFHGGAFGVEQERAQIVEQGWRFVNTDRMARERRTREVERAANLPVLDGRPVPAAARTDDLVRGFERCHAFLETHRDALIAAGGPLERFRGQRVRVILRDTRVYGAALRGSLHPRHLHAGIERSLHLEILRTSALARVDPPSYWGAFESEQRDLEELDFPYFWSFTDGTILHDSRDQPVGPFCAVAAYDQAVDRLARLDAGDRRHLASLVRFTYTLASAPVATTRRAAAAPPADAPLDAETALVEARAIADALASLVMRGSDGAAQWLGVDRAASEHGPGPRSLGERLYDGRAGVALFLAAVDAVGGTGHTELAADALRPLRRALRDPAVQAVLADRMGIGAGLGVGGLVYSLSAIARLTGDATWLDDARHAARALTPAAIAGDSVLDVLGGAAGAALGLLSLHHLSGERWVLDRAEACGHHLLRAWQPARAEIETGFAHGAAGVDTALARLAAATGTEVFRAAADEGFRRQEAAPSGGSMAAGHGRGGHAAPAAKFPWEESWCNGWVGVAIGRGSSSAADPRGVADRLAARESLDVPDHPCCGTLGGAELLLTTGQTDAALALAGRLVGRARGAGSYQIARDLPDARYAPSFFQGLSGIAYQLLRLTHPDRLPSVLAFR